jgi:hypothetical protein
VIVSVVHTAWKQMPLVFTVYTARSQMQLGLQILAAGWIVVDTIVKTKQRYCLLLSRHSEEERGMVECNVSVCMAKGHGYRCREGLRAKRGRPGAVVSAVSCARSMLSVENHWARGLLSTDVSARGLWMLARIANSTDWEGQIRIAVEMFYRLVAFALA